MTGVAGKGLDSLPGNAGKPVKHVTDNVGKTATGAVDNVYYTAGAATKGLQGTVSKTSGALGKGDVKGVAAGAGSGVGEFVFTSPSMLEVVQLLTLRHQVTRSAASEREEAN